MTRFLFTVGFATLLSAPGLNAQDEGTTVTFSGVQSVDFDGQFRMRAESRDSGANEGTDVLSRFRAGLDLKVDDYVRTYLQFQAHSDDLGNAVDGQIHQAFAYLSGLSNYFDLLLIGRFDMTYGHGRMISRNPFDNTGRAWDGFLASHSDDNYMLDLFWTRPVVGQATENPDETFGGFWYQRSLDVFDLNAYALKRGTGTRHDLTLGFIAATPDWMSGDYRNHDAAGLGWSLEFATQSADGNEEGSAMAAEAKYHLGGGLEVGVGLDTATDEFEPLYNNDFYYQGTASLFQWTNLTDAYGWVIKPMNENWRLYGALHRFSEDVATGSSGDALGTEFDLGVWGNLSEATEAWIGLSQYSGDDRNGNPADQLWLVGSIAVNF
jgi:hypothetical protein